MHVLGWLPVYKQNNTRCRRLAASSVNHRVTRRTAGHKDGPKVHGEDSDRPRRLACGRTAAAGKRERESFKDHVYTPMSIYMYS